MDGDERVVLQQGVRTGALEHLGPVVNERIGRTAHQAQEERTHAEEHDGGPRHHVVIGASSVVVQDEHDDGAEQQRPEQQRSSRADHIPVIE